MTSYEELSPGVHCFDKGEDAHGNFIFEIVEVDEDGTFHVIEMAGRQDMTKEDALAEYQDQAARVPSEEEILQEVSEQALTEVDTRHAAFLRAATGNASSEERDTWAVKLAAANALVAGEANESQINMLSTEAPAWSETTEEFATYIIGKAAAYEALVGHAGRVRGESRTAIKAASTTDEIQAALDAMEFSV